MKRIHHDRFHLAVQEIGRIDAAHHAKRGVRHKNRELNAAMRQLQSLIGLWYLCDVDWCLHRLVHDLSFTRFWQTTPALCRRLYARPVPPAPDAPEDHRDGPRSPG